MKHTKAEVCVSINILAGLVLTCYFNMREGQKPFTSAHLEYKPIGMLAHCCIYLGLHRGGKSPIGLFGWRCGGNYIPNPPQVSFIYCKTGSFNAVRLEIAG